MKRKQNGAGGKHETVCGDAREGKLSAMMEPKQKLMSEGPGDLRRKIFREIRDLDEVISVEEIDLLEKQAMKERLTEMKSTEVEETQLLLGVELLGGHQLGPEASKRRVISLCLKLELSKEIRRTVSEIFWPSQGATAEESVEESKTKQRHDVTTLCSQCVCSFTSWTT